MLKRLQAMVTTEPAVLLYALNAVLAAVVAFGVKATPGQTAAVTTIAAGVITVVTAWAARPVPVTTVTGAVATIAIAAGAFGLHLSAAEIGTAVPVLSVVLSLILRQAVTPVVTLRARGAAEPSAGPPVAG